MVKRLESCDLSGVSVLPETANVHEVWSIIIPVPKNQLMYKLKVKTILCTVCTDYVCFSQM